MKSLLGFHLFCVELSHLLHHLLGKNLHNQSVPGSLIDWTDPDHGVGVLHEEVEDEGDEADEGQDGDANHFLLVGSIQFVLSDAPDNHQEIY